MDELSLETLRLRLRLMRPSDADELINIFGDPKVMVSFNSAPFNHTQMKRWIEGNLSTKQSMVTACSQLF